MTFHLFRTGKAKNYHYRFQIAGARVQRSTRESSKAKANVVAQRAYDEALTLTNGGKVVPTLAAMAQEWLEVNGPISSAAHQRSVETTARLHFYDLGDLPLNQITTSHVELARNQHLVDHKPASANHWLRVLKLIANWAVKREIIRSIPWQVRMLKVQKRPRSILPIAAVAEWFAAVDQVTRADPSVATAIRLMFGLGLRESEAAGARWEWLDWQRATYTPGITKGREAEPVPVPAWLVEQLAPHRQVEGLIAGKRGGAQQHPPGFARKAMKSANLSCKIKGITPHRLRGTFATMLSEQGVPIQTIQAVMRHKSPMTTMAYLEKNRDTAAQAQNDIAEKIGFGRGEKVAGSATQTRMDTSLHDYHQSSVVGGKRRAAHVPRLSAPLNRKANMDTKIEAVPVVRNADGEYHHPDMPLFYEGDEANYKAWLDAQGLTMQMVWMESDAPVLAGRYMEDQGNPSALIDWQPTAPEGAGWFVLAIFDTEDGPVAHFARRWLAAE